MNRIPFDALQCLNSEVSQQWIQAVLGLLVHFQFCYRLPVILCHTETISVSFFLTGFSNAYIPCLAGWVHLISEKWWRMWTYLNAKEVNCFKIAGSAAFLFVAFVLYLSPQLVVFLSFIWSFNLTRSSECERGPLCCNRQSFYFSFATWKFSCPDPSWIFHECVLLSCCLSSPSTYPHYS